MARNSLAYLPSEAWQSTWPTTWQQLHPTLFTRRPSYQSKLNQLSRLSSVPARSMPLSWDYVRDRVDLWVLTKVEKKKKNRNSWPEATINCSKLDTIAKKIAGILNKGIVKCQELGDNNSSLCINFKRNERSPGSSLTLILTRSKNSFSLLFSFLKKKERRSNNSRYQSFWPGFSGDTDFQSSAGRAMVAHGTKIHFGSWTATWLSI